MFDNRRYAGGRGAAGNLGATTLRRRRASRDPMREFDSLPPELRQWLRAAALPWSSASCRRIWRKAQRRGETPCDILRALDDAERRTLQKDRTHLP